MASSSEALDKIRLSKISILVVDDDKVISKLVQNVLKNLGFGTVLIAHSAPDGLHILENNPIDLVITDWEMEPMTGLEFTKTIRRLDSPKRYMPIIMLTGHSEQSQIDKARDCGVTEYLSKPFTAKSLCSQIMATIESPRSFVLSREYSGPSRRRIEKKPEPTDRRRRRKED